MAQVIERINELKALPSDQHLFCPRVGDDYSVYYDEDTADTAQDDDARAAAERKRKVKEAEERKWVALDALQILAFDGDEAKAFQSWIADRLHTLMTSCDVCVRVFHQSRAEWRAKLLEQYDEDNIVDFLRIVDDLTIKRITSGLAEANEVLLAAAPNKRGVRILPPEATYAFFEGLSCDAFIRDEALLQKHFDPPFQLVQTKKRLKLPILLPAMTRFLFSSNQLRRNWANGSWSDFRRNVLASEFEWAVRDHFVDAMSRVQFTNLELPFVESFWAGTKLIIAKLDANLITHKIRELEGNFYKLILDHQSLRSEGYLDLIATLALLLEKSPVAFWDAMNAITPSNATVVEQVLNSPVLKQILLMGSDENQEQQQLLDSAFTWITPFLASIKAANLTLACKAFSTFFFGLFQSNSYPQVSRDRCFREGIRVLDISFKKMNVGKSVSNFVGQPTVNGMLEILSAHIRLIVNRFRRSGEPKSQGDLRQAFSMLEDAFTLESQSLAVERQLISVNQASPSEIPPSRPIWEAVVGAIDANSIDLAVHLLVAGRNLIGLEVLMMKPSVDKIPATVRHFNGRFELLSQTITDVLDRLAEFEPAKLVALFDQPAAACAIISTLFSSTPGTRNSSVELLKIISAQDERRDALQFILKAYYKNVLQGVSDSCRQVKRLKAFSPSPSLIKTCLDIIDIMCNSQDGILRSRSLSPAEAGVTLTLWKNLWDTLTVIFKTTEDWSNLGFYDKTTMQEFCRDTMQFADFLFDQCSIFTTALEDITSNHQESRSRTKLQKELLELPAMSMGGLAKWLRLRDEFLSSKSGTLTGKLLGRLKRVSIEVDQDTLSYIQRILIGDIRAKLSLQQTAELQRALEYHLGHAIVTAEEPKQPKQGSISKWMATGSTDAEDRAKLMAETTPASRAFQAKRETIRAKVPSRAEQDRATQQAEFRKKRQADLEKLNKEKEAVAALAQAKKARGLSAYTAEAGSGLEGLGILGKEQAPKGEGLMHSSDESDEGDFDDDLFPGMKQKRTKSGPKTNIVDAVKIQMPVKKRRVVRSVKDMRARLAPDLSSLHKAILGWDYFHEGEFPPKTRQDIYSAVPNTFRTPNDYQSTFEPLLTLEAWQGFVRSREENQPKPYEIRIVSRASVDAFQEVSSTMTHKENQELRISEGDVVLLSQSSSPSREDRYCLARVFRVQRKQAHLEVSYRVMPSSPLQSSLVPNGTVYGTKITSITPLEREFGALVGLQYYDLCDEIIRAKPSPLLDYKDSHLNPLISNYNVNKAQAKAVKSAIDNDAFTLIQGPPGSGKTKTIVAIVGAILSDTLRHMGTQVQVPGARTDTATKKLLVCAPSNAAVDELVMRFKKGIKTLNGQERQVNIVRLGRSDAINANVVDVTLEELVNKKLGMDKPNGDAKEKSKRVFEQHGEISRQVREAQEQLNSGLVKGPEASKLQDDLTALRRQKALLGTKIDAIKDEERAAGRNADMARRRVQEQILGNAHIICATLSGSGHEMFQGLSIEFETVIVDEAAQCVEMSALIPLKYGCAKCILVGDPKQLPPTVFSRQAAAFSYEQSLFVRMQKNHPDDVHLLDTQYRMHPEISLFPSQTFYDGKLLDGGDMAGLRKQVWHESSLLGPYRFFDVAGQHQAAPQGRSLINNAEINVALQLYKRLTTDYHRLDWKGKIGIITPYKSQLMQLKRRFSEIYGQNILEDVEFNTTDAFQGRESEIIIFSCVRASPAGGIGFLQDIRRMNVGLTRAKSSLWVLGNAHSLEKGEFWRKLVEDARRRKKYSTGDLMGMLNQSSKNFPAPIEEGYNMPSHPKIKQAPQGDTMNRKPSNSYASDVKVEPVFKQELVEIKSDPHLKAEKAPKQKPMDISAPVPGGKRKLSSDEDIDMVDAKSDSTNTASRQSTPAALSDATRGSATPVPDASNARPEPTAPRPPGDVVGRMLKPKIRRRPREAVNPLLQRPNKKPRTG